MKRVSQKSTCACIVGSHTTTGRRQAWQAGRPPPTIMSPHRRVAACPKGTKNAKPPYKLLPKSSRDAKQEKKFAYLFDFTCHPCTGTMLIFSVYLSVCVMSPSEEVTILSKTLTYKKAVK